MITPLPDIAVDNSDALHVVWEQATTIMYTTKPKGGAWSSPLALPEARGYTPSVAIDSEGTACIVWSGKEGLSDWIMMSMEKPAGGAWTAPAAVGGSYQQGFPPTDLAVAPDGTLHAAWGGGSYASKPLHGSWTAAHVNSGGGQMPSLTVDAAGTVHLISSWGQQSSNIDYVAKRAGGDWSQPVTLVRDAQSGVIAASGADLFLVWDSVDAAYISQIFYMHKPGGGDWDAPISLSQYGQWSEQPVIAVAAGMAPHAVWRGTTMGSSHTMYRGVAPTSLSGDSILAQAITVPADWPAPTLSFLYRTQGQFGAGGSRFAVSINDGQSTAIFSSTAVQTAWTQRWVDLSPWAGRTVTLTLAVHQVAGSTPSAAYIDEVATGSVYPDLSVVQAATSASPGQPLTITVSYRNRGPVAAAGVSVTLDRPAGVSFTGASLPPATTAPLAWNVGSLAAGSGPFTITVSASAAAAGSVQQPLTSTAYIGSPAAEPDQADNRHSLRLDVAYRLYLPLMLAP